VYTAFAFSSPLQRAKLPEIARRPVGGAIQPSGLRRTMLSYSFVYFDA
jgi:hypothetical protein